MRGTTHATLLSRRAFRLMTYTGCIATTLLTYTLSGGLDVFALVSFLNGAFTLGFSYSWMAIYLAALFTSPVRAMASSFVFNGARMVAWIFPVIAGRSSRRSAA